MQNDVRNIEHSSNTRNNVIYQTEPDEALAVTENANHGMRPDEENEQRTLHKNNERYRHRQRGRLAGSKNKPKPQRKRSTTAYDDEDVLKLARAWIEVSQMGMMKGAALWEEVRKICERRYGLKRSEESLRSKWREAQHEVQQWLAIKEQNLLRASVTGGLTQEAMERFCGKVYLTRMTKAGRRPKPFKYFRTAAFLEQYPKFQTNRKTSNGNEFQNSALSRRTLSNANERKEPSDNVFDITSRHEDENNERNRRSSASALYNPGNDGRVENERNDGTNASPGLKPGDDARAETGTVATISGSPPRPITEIGIETENRNGLYQNVEDDVGSRRYDGNGIRKSQGPAIGSNVGTREPSSGVRDNASSTSPPPGPFICDTLQGERTRSESHEKGGRRTS